MKKLILSIFVLGTMCVQAARKGSLSNNDEVVTPNELDAKVAPVEQKITAVDGKATEALDLAGDTASLVYGDDCRLISTWYNSVTRMPYLSLQFKMKDEETGTNFWYKVWDELTRYNYIIDQHLPTNFYTKAQMDAALDTKADRAWGHYDSHTGAYAPDGFTWISSPKIAIAGGLAYQRVVTSEGAIFVLMSNGMTTVTGGETNGFFRISDDKGKTLFEITKGSESVQGATSWVKSTEQINGYTHLYLDYFVESPRHPTIEVCTDLHRLDWKSETDPECLANVVWTGTSGHYNAEVWGKQPYTVLFVRASYLQGAQDVIRHNAPVEFGSSIVIRGTTYNNLRVEEISGKKVLVVDD